MPRIMTVFFSWPNATM